MNQAKRSITSIKVRNLFGRYDYDLPTNSEKKNINEIMILYGNNGSGKTTILKAIFHLLSTEERAGHKSFISQLKFAKIEICFSDNIKIVALRNLNQIIGSFKMQIYLGRQKKCEHFFKANEENIRT